MNLVIRHRITFLIVTLTILVLAFVLSWQTVQALNILEYKDTISDSGPGQQSNHTISFVLNTDISPGSEIEVTPPPGFTTIASTTFGLRNVELLVNGIPRVATTSASAGVDMVEITTGSPGLIRYTLAPDFSITSGSELELKIGNHTTNRLIEVTTFSTSTGTTTTPGDIEPITNSVTLGRHDMKVEIYDGGLVANANPLIFLVNKVQVPNVDTTESIPPYRFNPQPTGIISGTSLNVEISLETDEFAWCNYDTTAGVDYFSMAETFTNTGNVIFHSTVVAVVPNTTQIFYVRCIDDEGNFNTDDFIITFTVNDVPSGSSNTEGETEGDGTGTGNEGTGDGGGAGGDTGNSDGEQPLEGSSSGSGGSGGGGGGGSGGNSGSTAGGGFESSDAPYRSGDGRVIISGYAFPNSTVGFLIDGKFYKTGSSNNAGAYSVTLEDIARGVYTFGVYAEGDDDVRSSTFSTSFTVTGGRTTSLSNINVSPSVLVEPDPVDVGQTVTFSGYALSDSIVTLQNGRINSSAQTFTTEADSGGNWSYELSTNGFTSDTYQVRAKSEQDGGKKTGYSDYTFYGVGQDADLPISADLNTDGSVNLIDFSILLYWWSSNGGDSNPPADINRDGTVSLTDFSIMLFNWTG